jgi:hypothetical protein
MEIPFKIVYNNRKMIVNNRELKQVDNFKDLRSMLTRDGYRTRKI